MLIFISILPPHTHLHHELKPLTDLVVVDVLHGIMGIVPAAIKAAVLEANDIDLVEMNE
nr:hypothetical protein [Tanacetum cinerariifolium]